MFLSAGKVVMGGGGEKVWERILDVVGMLRRPGE
jgi:hypothetical protein